VLDSLGQRRHQRLDLPANRRMTPQQLAAFTEGSGACHRLVDQRCDARALAKVRPALVPRVHVVELQPADLEERLKGKITIGLCVVAQLFGFGAPARGDGVLDARQDDLARHGVELHVAARGQIRKAALDLRRDLTAATPQQRSELEIEAELRTVQTHEVEHGTHLLRRVPALAVSPSSSSGRTCSSNRRYVAAPA
jgi:hypothetical protein